MTTTGNNQRQMATQPVVSESPLARKLEEVHTADPITSTATPMTNEGPTVPSQLGTGSVWLRYSMPQLGLLKGTSSTRG